MLCNGLGIDILIPCSDERGENTNAMDPGQSGGIRMFGSPVAGMPPLRTGMEVALVESIICA